VPDIYFSNKPTGDKNLQEHPSIDAAIATVFQTVVLDSADAANLYELYKMTDSLTPYGFLARRQLADFEKALVDPNSTVAVGVRKEGRLIAYSICRRATRLPYPGNFFLSRIDPAVTPLYIGMGTVVHPDFQGHLLMTQMLGLRRRLLAERKVLHMAGLVAVDNFLSIGILLRADAALLGFQEDETAMNYIAYGGEMLSRLEPQSDSIAVPVGDMERQAQMFDSGHIAFALRPGKMKQCDILFRPLIPSKTLTGSTLCG
jgi:hypothetical protein